MNASVNHQNSTLSEKTRNLLPFSRRQFCVAAVALLVPLGGLPLAQASDSGESKSEPGITYIHKKTDAPWSIHILKIDRSRKDLAFYTPHARNRVLGVSLLAEQAKSIPSEIGRAIAGINGDFYIRDNPTYAGDPRGLQIVNGELLSAPNTVCVWFNGEGNPHLDEVKGDFNVKWPGGTKTPIGLNEERKPKAAVLYTPSYAPAARVIGGRHFILEKDGNGPWLPLQASQTYKARIRDIQSNAAPKIVAGTMVLSVGPSLADSLPEITSGSLLEISTATTPSMKDVKTAVGGGPALITAGKPFAQQPPPGAEKNWSERSKYERHPRSAMGWSPTHVYFVIVDGRQPGLSVGMKLAELADYMIGLGCTDAINLDGGKSAQMWMNGEIKNSPCQGEDTVANSIFVVRKP
jgi:hypothetical protein